MNLRRIREISSIVLEFEPDYKPTALGGLDVDLSGYSEANLTLAVCKETKIKSFGIEQATFMLFLGEQVCPRILCINDYNYVMEYLNPASLSLRGIVRVVTLIPSPLTCSCIF